MHNYNRICCRNIRLNILIIPAWFASKRIRWRSIVPCKWIYLVRLPLTLSGNCNIQAREVRLILSVEPICRKGAGISLRCPPRRNTERYYGPHGPQCLWGSDWWQGIHAGTTRLEKHGWSSRRGWWLRWRLPARYWIQTCKAGSSMWRTPSMLRKRSLRCSPRSLATDIPGVSRISGSNPERLLTAGTAAEPMLGRGGILLCPRGFPAVTVRLKLRDGAAKSPCTCGLDSEIYTFCFFFF